MGATVPPKVPQTRPCIPEEDVAALLEDFAAILRSGRLTMGPYLQRFEQEFAACVGAEHARGYEFGDRAVGGGLALLGGRRGGGRGADEYVYCLVQRRAVGRRPACPLRH